MSIICVFKTRNICVSTGNTFVNPIDLDVDCVYSYIEREIFLCAMENIFCGEIHLHVNPKMPL